MACSDGSATAYPSGGNPPYNYLWNTGDWTPSIFNIGIGIYTVCVTDVDGCETCDTASVAYPTSIENMAVENEITIYPNPAGNTLTIQNVPLEKENNMNAIITDLTGRSVTSLSFKDLPSNPNGNIEIDVHEIKPGIYFLKLISASGKEANTKLIVSR